jgi:hypothetical protein
MTVKRMGSTSKYSSNWAAAFGAKKKSSPKSSGSKATRRSKARKGKKS